MRYKINKDRRYKDDFFTLMVDSWRPGLEDNGWLYYVPTGMRGGYVSNEPDGYWTEWVDVEVFGGLPGNAVRAVTPQWCYELMDPESRTKHIIMPKVVLPGNCYKEEL